MSYHANVQMNQKWTVLLNAVTIARAQQQMIAPVVSAAVKETVRVVVKVLARDRVVVMDVLIVVVVAAAVAVAVHQREVDAQAVRQVAVVPVLGLVVEDVVALV